MSPIPSIASTNKSLAATLAVCGALLTACGGGGNSVVDTSAGAPAPAPAPVPSSTTLTGVAATGAPFAGATVVVTPQAGDPITCASPSAADGSFSCVLPAGTVGPLVLTATLGSEVHYSVAPTAASGTVNITKLTDVIVSQLSPNGDPAALAAAVRADASTASATALQAQVKRLVDALQPLFTALNLTAADPISGSFSANGTGQDKVLDSLVVTVRPTGDTATVSIAVRSTDDVPPAVNFSTGASVTSTPIAALPTVTSATLASLPGPAAVADFLARLTACYALAPSVRVRGGNDSGNVTGTAADVIAPACRTLFVGDDPATYYSNGLSVGRNASNVGSFAGLFRSGATGVAFDNGVAEYLRSNAEKDVVVSYRQTDTARNISYDSFVVRNVAGTLKLIGNQNAFVGRVRPYQEYRELLNSPSYSSYNVGYNVDIDDVLVSGASIFSKVEVTPPAGVVDSGTSTTVFTFVPSAGTSYLSLQVAPGVTAIRLNAQFQDKTLTAAVGSKETGLYFVSPLKTDAQLAVMPEQGAWTLKYYFVDTTRTPVVQTTRTFSRSLSIAELRKAPMMDATAGLRSDLVASSKDNGGIVFGALSSEPNIIDFSADGDLDGWVVPTGAAAPTALNVLGNAPFGSTTAGVAGQNFNDSVALTSSTRKVKVFCARQTVNDKHCDTTQTTQYAQGSKVNQFNFSAYDQKQVQTSRRFALYILQ